MAKTLFISPLYVKQKTLIKGNLDNDKMLQFIDIAQEIHIQNVIGTDLKDRLESGISADDLTANESDLLSDYIMPALAHWTMVEFLPYSNFSISNKGVFKESAENSESATSDDIEFLMNKQRDVAMYWNNRLIDYLCYNSDLFPEYTTNIDEDVKPKRDETYPSWMGL